MTDEVRTEQRGRMLLITLNRPQARNAINAALAQGVLDAVARLDDDPGLTVGVLTGAGRAFCVGMDLKAFSQGEDVRAIMTFIKNGARKPIIAAVEGYALAGGLELALSCDLIVASEGTQLGIPEVAVGVFASGGGLLRLPSRVGFGKAMEMALTGEPILAEDAARYGLVARLAATGAGLDTAVELAERVARNAPLAVATSKALVKASQGITEAEYWPMQDPHEEAVRNSADAEEGSRSFVEKRDPRWTGA